MRRHFERMGVIKHTYLYVYEGVSYYVRAESLKGGGFLLSMFLSPSETERVASDIAPEDATIGVVADFVVEYCRGQHVE